MRTLIGTFTLWAYIRTPSAPCPLCVEEEDTTAHFIAQCSAMLLRKNILGDYILSSDTLSNIHWFLLLKIARASFY